MGSRARRGKKEEKKEENVSNDIGNFDEFASTELLAQIASSDLPQIYGGDVKEANVFTFVDSIYFGVVFEADGFRGKSIKIIVRKEKETKCGHCAMFGDYIVLKDGNLIFQFRNLKGAKRLNLKYKIEHNVFPQSFVQKYLPDYNAEERLLQTNTLNVGGKNRRSKAAKTWSEYSGSTALSTSPPPENLSSLSVKSTKNDQKIMAKSAR